MASKDLQESEDIEETRTRKMTEKGLIYTLEIKMKKYDSIFRRLKKEYVGINDMMTSDPSSKEIMESVRQAYSGLLKLYDELFDAREECVQLMEDPGLTKFMDECRVHEAILTSWKANVEVYFLKFGTVQTKSQDTKRNSVISSKKRSVLSGTSVASTISSAQLREKQKQAELQAKAKALKQKQELDRARLELKMKEEELKLKTEIEISEAKSKVLNSYGAGQCGSEHGSKRIHVIVPKQEIGPQNVEKSQLNPHAPVFTGTGCVDQGASNTNFITDAGVIKSVVQQLRKPLPDIDKFSGNPLDFQKFMRQFRTKIVVNSSSNDELMSYLEQFTTGEAHHVVKGYSYLDASRGYQAALAELEERYGNEEIIANALIKKALDWPNIKHDNVKALDNYAIFLNECQNAVNALSAVKVLEYPDNLRRLVMKLPFAQQDRWRNIILQIRLSRGSVKFQDLVQFVRKEAKKATDPLFGRDAMRFDVKATQVSKKVSGYSSGVPKSNVFASTELSRSSQLQSHRQADRLSRTGINTSAVATSQPSPDDTSKSCAYCNDHSHSIDSCNKLQMKPHVDRLAFLRSKGLCFRCFIRGHRSKDCGQKAECTYCKGNHQSILHLDRDQDRKVVTACTQYDGSDDMEAGDGSCTLAIIPVKVAWKDGLKIETTYAFLDPGSTVSFCSESLARKLGYHGKRMEITLGTMGKPHTSFVTAVNGLQVFDLDLSNAVSLPTVYSREEMPVTNSHIPTSTDVSQWSHLSDLHIPQVGSGIELMIGGNVPDAYTPSEVRTGPAGSPHATRTRLGWTLWNVVRPSHMQETKEQFPSMRTEILAVSDAEELKELDKLIRQSMNFDFPEKTIDDKKEMSREDKKFVDKVSESIALRDGHYYIKLPLKNEDICLPDNNEMAMQRLKSLKKKFSANPKFYEDYKTFVADVIKKGYAEKVKEAEIEVNTGKHWYIPHHGVYHPRKPDKIRVVFDCAARYQGTSLNSVLLQGPNLVRCLLGVLLRFRQEPVAVMGDIENMYHRVKVPKEDRDLLRFYWWPEGDLVQEPQIYRMTVHLFGAISSSSCATYALQQTAKDNSDAYSQDVVTMINDDFYVDDFLASATDEEKAVSMVQDVTRLCAEGGFRLTKWTSNSHSVMKSIPEDERAKDVKHLNLDRDTLPSERALGVYWFVESDTIGFKIVAKSQPATRRGILSVVSSVYDPLGLVSLFILTAKQLLQNLCRKDLGWDEEIDEVSLKLWTNWQRDLPKLEDIQLERCYKPKGFGKVKSCQLHLFSDASDSGYGVVAYLRLKNDTDEVHCVLIMAISRVAPLKKITTPRMELTAATVAVRLSRVIADELRYHLNNTFFWTDSMSVLRYISNNTCRFQTFVANRVAVIVEASQVDQWRYVSSLSNPADCASRGMHLDKFLVNKQWFHGPEFLWMSDSYWPQIHDSRYLPDDDPEVKPLVRCMFVAPVAGYGFDKLLNYYSSWKKLKRAVGWMIVVVKKLQEKVLRRKELSKKASLDIKLTRPMLTTYILQCAEMALIRFTQRQHFPKELQIFSEKSEATTSNYISKSSPLYRLDPFVEDDIIRVGGRLERAKLQYDLKHPIILPKTSPVSSLIIQDAHSSVGHMGRNATLSHLRQRYWILGAGAAVKTLVSKCVICRKYQAPDVEQKMADLPEERLQPDLPPFSHTGMDYFGPFLVKRGRGSVKRYGVLFTCLTMRAVHLEVANSLDTDSCINAIRRFIARRGPPKTIRSDNGTNLVGSQRELRGELEKLNQSKINSVLLDKGTDWYFNPPAASHHGGVWERVIRLARKVLFSVMQGQVIKLDDESLNTLFCEVELILNGRPITDVSGDPQDINPLTPNHLLFLRSGERFPPGLFSKDDSYSRRRWRQVQYLADLFWTRWCKEYLPLLQSRQKWARQRRNLCIDDIVLLIDSSPRNSWSLGRVTEVVSDKRGLVLLPSLYALWTSFASLWTHLVVTNEYVDIQTLRKRTQSLRIWADVYMDF